MPSTILIKFDRFIVLSRRPRGASGQTLASHRWGPEFASRSLHVGFVVDETGSGQVFRGVSPIFPYHKFHSTISPHSSHPFRSISSALVMVRQAWSAGTLATHASHPSTRPCVGHELRIFIYSTFDTQQYDTIGFSKKCMKLEKYFLIYCPLSKHWPISFKFDISCKYLHPIFPFMTNP